MEKHTEFFSYDEDNEVEPITNHSTAKDQVAAIPKYSEGEYRMVQIVQGDSMCFILPISPTPNPP